MTAKNLYEGVLIELNKENASNVLLEDFNYFANKAINNYINKRYNIYDINQQTTDDLRVLKATAVLDVNHCEDYEGLTMAGKDSMANYEVTMPSDYLHILNCICIYKVKKTYKCYNEGDYWRAPATRLTADMYSQVLDNFWNKPTYKRPYYYIHNVNTSVEVPTNPYIGYQLSNQSNDNDPGENGDYRTVLKSSVSILQATEEESNSELLSEPTELSSEPKNYPVIEGKLYQVLLKYENGWNDIKIIGIVNETRQGKGNDISSTAKSGTYHSDDAAGYEDSTTYSYGKDGKDNPIVQGTGLPDSITIDGTNVSNRERGQGIRYGNVSLVRLEIRYGR